MVRLLPVGYEVSCIGSVPLWLEAILQLEICEVGAGFLMDLQLVLAKLGNHDPLSCGMKPSKGRTSVSSGKFPERPRSLCSFNKAHSGFGCAEWVIIEISHL